MMIYRWFRIKKKKYKITVNWLALYNFFERNIVNIKTREFSKPLLEYNNILQEPVKLVVRTLFAITSMVSRH